MEYFMLANQTYSVCFLRCYASVSHLATRTPNYWEL